MVWDKIEMQWQKKYKYAEEYFRKFGNLNVSEKYVTEDGVCLGQWVFSQKKKYKCGKLPDKHIKRLSEIGMNLN